MFKVGDTVVVTHERWDELPRGTAATIVGFSQDRTHCWIMNDALPRPPSYGGYLHGLKHIRPLTKLDKALN